MAHLVHLRPGPPERGLPKLQDSLIETQLDTQRCSLKDIVGFRTPRPEEHSMADSLANYSFARLPWQHLQHLDRLNIPIELHTAPGDILQLHPAKFGFGIVEKLSWKPHTQKKVFNYKRPELFLVQELATCQHKAALAIVPGLDYVRHYASMLLVMQDNILRFAKAQTKTMPEISVVAYPRLLDDLAGWSGLGSICHDIQKEDVVIVGYVAEIRAIMQDQLPQAKVLSDNRTLHYHCVRLQVEKDLTFCFIGTAYSFWGDMSCSIVHEIGLHRPRAICYVGKNGVLTRPQDIHNRISSPSSFCVFDKGQLKWTSGKFSSNPLAIKFPQLDGGLHCSVPTVVEETYQLRDSLDSLRVASIDNEVSQMAQTIEELNQGSSTTKETIGFVPFLFATDYLRHKDQSKLSVKYDLTSRNAVVARKKHAFLLKATDKILQTFKPGYSSIKAVIVGTGYGVKVILPTLRKRQIQVIGIIGGGDMKKTREIADDWGIPHVDLDLQQLKNEGGMNLLFVASPHSEHAKVVREALELGGVDIVCEKPLGLSISQSAALGQLAANSNSICSMNHPLRFYYPFQVMQEEIKRTDSYEIKITYNTRRLLSYKQWNWTFDRDQGGGMVLAMATHFLDLVEFLGRGSSSTALQSNVIGSKLKFSNTRAALPDDKLGVTRTPSAESQFSLEGLIGNARFTIESDGCADHELFEVRIEARNSPTLEFRSIKGEPCTLKRFSANDQNDDVTQEDTIPLPPCIASQSPWQASFAGFAEELVDRIIGRNSGSASLSPNPSNSFQDFERYLVLLSDLGFPLASGNQTE